MTIRHGFTLVELLVVVAIIGLLATLSVVALGTTRQNARDARRLQNIRTVMTALEFYNDLHGSYPVGRPSIPVPQVELGSDVARVLTSSGFAGTAPAGAEAYLTQVPSDPLPSQTYLYMSRFEALGSGCADDPCPRYTLQFTLERGAHGLPAGVICARPPSAFTIGSCS